MRKEIKTMALFMALSMMAVGCQKENDEGFVNGSSVSGEGTVYTVLYSINGIQHRNILHSEEEYRAFIHELMNLARQGYEVVLYNENTWGNNATTKETIYYSTTDQADAENWAMLRQKEGYSVSIIFDEQTKTYNCVAWR